MANGEIDLKSMLNLRNQKNKPYTEQEILYIFLFLSKQYDFLEKKRISHSDVKPQNIIVAKNPKNQSEYIYCIADFGTSFLLERKEKKMPCIDLFGFSPKYAAPEIELIEKGEYKHETYDPFLADVYSLGVSILEIMGRKKDAFFEKN